MKIALETLGCKLNQAETELIARQFTRLGFDVGAPDRSTGVYILNTCTVTQSADSKACRKLRLARRRNPQGIVIVTGCYAERASQEIKQLNCADLIINNQEKFNLVELVMGMITKEVSQPPNTSRGYRTRSFVKIQDGCDNLCTYCIVPYVRNKKVSISPDKIIEEIKDRVADGHREVVLTGTEIGSYKYGDNDLRLLTKQILYETGVTRLRLSSLQPQEISTDLVRLWQDRRLCRHFHIALQSGCDNILNRMNRGYSLDEYRRAVSMVRAHIPGVAITTDVMVGFPGETDDQFEETLDFCRQMKFARIHVFPFSPRKETEAAKMPNKVVVNTIKRRSQRAIHLARESSHNFCRHFKGRIMGVLWEKHNHNLWVGYSDNYIRVYTESNEDLTNELLTVKIIGTKDDGLLAEVMGRS